MVLVSGAIDRADLALKISRLLPPGIDYFLAFKADTIKPSLCLGYLQGQPTLPNTIEEVKGAIAYFDASPQGSSISAAGHYDLTINSDNDQIKHSIDINIISLTLESFLFNNLGFYNHIEDIMYEEMKQLEFESLYTKISNYDAFVKMMFAEFSVNAEILRVNEEDGPITSLCKNSVFYPGDYESIRGHILHSLRRAQVIEAMVDRNHLTEENLEGGHEYRYVFPIRSKSKGIIQTNEFMIVESFDKIRLSVLKIFSINQCVEEYAYTRVRLGQRKCLYWQTKCVTDLIESVDNTTIDQAVLFRVYMDELAQFVVSSTQGHSFAYLSYDASEEALSRAVATFKPVADELDIDGGISAPVPLKDHSHYVSAHLFEQQSHGSERDIYLRSIRNRSEWAQFGLESVRCRRNMLIDQGLVRGARTQSEAAFIIHDQGMPVGVICVECPYRDGLANDLDFLRQVASNASIYRSFLFRMGDQRWLRRNLKLQDVVHELEKVTLAIKDEGVRSRLSEISDDLAIQPAGDEHDSRTFVDRIDHVVREEVGSEALLHDMGQPVKVFNPPRHDVPHSVQMAAIHIIRILLQNRVHGPGVLPVSVVTRDFHAGVRNALLIRASLTMSMPQSEIQDAFRRPIRRADREHVGLYMIGVLVRAWGGRLDFDRREGAATRKLEICIPFRRSSGGIANESHPYPNLVV